MQTNRFLEATNFQLSTQQSTLNNLASHSRPKYQPLMYRVKGRMSAMRKIKVAQGLPKRDHSNADNSQPVVTHRN